MIERLNAQIDTNIFREALFVEATKETKRYGNQFVFEKIQDLNRTKITIDGINLSKEEVFTSINIREYGYKQRKDVIITSLTNLDNNQTEVVFVPKVIYELIDYIELPKSVNRHTEVFKVLLSDSFERFKIKAEYVICHVQNSKEIKLYVNKTTQFLDRLFYDVNLELGKWSSKDNKTVSFKLLTLAIFNIYLLIYMQKMFSNFYDGGNKYTKNELFVKLLDKVSLSNLCNIMKCDKDSQYDSLIELLFKWNGNINILITALYDALHANVNELGDSKLLECSNKDLVAFLSTFVVDKKGKKLSVSTIETCLNEKRPDKRAKGDKRIDVEGFFLNA